ncbi:MAG: hypothetical protein R3B68_00305 [Phycisphaerales bacterium]
MLRSAHGCEYLTDRCCLTCGYRGRELQGRRGHERLVCPQCRQDLYVRPARSYAEMEGLVENREGALAHAPSTRDGAARGRRVSIFRLAGGLIGRVGMMFG